MANRRLTNPAFIACVALLFGSAGAIAASVLVFGVRVFKKEIQAEYRLNGLSSETANWKQINVDKPYGADIEETLGTKNYINRVYQEKSPKNPDRPRVLELHAAYYSGGIDTVPHVPERCLVGGGFSLISGPSFVPLKLDRSSWIEDEPATALVQSIDRGATIYTARLGPYSSTPGIRVRLPRKPENIGLFTTGFSEPRSGAKLHAGYFFIANGGISQTAEGVRVLAFDKKSEYAYYLKVQVSSMQVSSAEELAEQASDLLNELLPDLMLCVPDWVRVQQGDYPPEAAAKKAASAKAGGN